MSGPINSAYSWGSAVYDNPGNANVHISKAGGQDGLKGLYRVEFNGDIQYMTKEQLDNTNFELGASNDHSPAHHGNGHIDGGLGIGWGYGSHLAAHEFASLTRGEFGDGRTLLAQNTSPGERNHATDLNTRQTSAGAQPKKTCTAKSTGAPIDMQRMVAMNRTVQNFDVKRSPIPEADLRATQRSFQAATDALQRGDYKAAQSKLNRLGFPLPPLSSNQKVSNEASITAHMLGVPARSTKDGGWSVTVQYGARGNQAVNDLNGFAVNTRMINRMSSTPCGVSNLPTEAQSMAYMKNFAQPAKGPHPVAQDVMQAASDITAGSIVHYSSAGTRDPQYDANPNLRAFYRDRHGVVHEFASPGEARAAAKAGKPPLGRGERITTMSARSPDEWSDISSRGTRASRNVGDCESKLYLQTRLLTQAGFTSLGSVEVHPRSGGIGHMLGVFKAPDGSTWVTSNEEFRQVHGTGTKGAVTQADLDTTLRTMTADVYHIQPNRAGVRDTSNFNFSAAATSNQTGPNAATDTIRRSTEMGMMRLSETLIP